MNSVVYRYSLARLSYYIPSNIIRDSFEIYTYMYLPYYPLLIKSNHSIKKKKKITKYHMYNKNHLKDAQTSTVSSLYIVEDEIPEIKL